MNKKLLTSIIALAIVGIFGIQLTIGHTEADPFDTDLIAGQHYDAGQVLVWNDGNDIHVKYVTEDGWELSETHLYVGKTNPNELTTAPGQFPYSSSHDPMDDYYEYIIPLDDIDGYHMKVNKQGKVVGNLQADGNPGVDTGDGIFIAAHAVVCKEIITSGGLEDVEESLPDQVTLQAVHATEIPPYDQGYFQATISGGTMLDGIYPAWCIDLDIEMMNNQVFTANVYSSYETLPSALLAHIAYPETLPEVNYILNQHYISEESGCDGMYTYGDVQRAIWEFIESWQSTQYLGPWETCRASEIYEDAEANGNNYVPGCEEEIAIILEPTNLNDGQICIIPIPIPCETQCKCETAWGEGSDFSQSNWAMYFAYAIQ